MKFYVHLANSYWELFIFLLKRNVVKFLSIIIMSAAKVHFRTNLIWLAKLNRVSNKWQELFYFLVRYWTQLGETNRMVYIFSSDLAVAIYSDPVHIQLRSSARFWARTKTRFRGPRSAKSRSRFEKERGPRPRWGPIGLGPGWFLGVKKFEYENYTSFERTRQAESNDTKISLIGRLWTKLWPTESSLEKLFLCC